MKMNNFVTDGYILLHIVTGCSKITAIWNNLRRPEATWSNIL